MVSRARSSSSRSTEELPWDGDPDDIEQFIREMQSALAIDKNALDENCQTHSDCIYRIANRLNESISLRDAAKNELTQKEAEVDARLRHDAEVADEKITEKQVRSETTRDRNVQKAQKELHRLNATVGRLAALKDAWQHRSYMLNNMTELHKSGYFSVSVGNRGDNQMRTDRARHAREEQHRARTRHDD